MSGTHRIGVDRLYVQGTSPLHRLVPEAKLAGLLAFVLAVALTPRRHVAVFAVAAVVLVALIAVGRLPVRVVAARLLVIAPFVVFALVTPFIGTGERVDVAWFSLSVDGLWASWNVLAKATLGATAGIVVVATTPVPDVLRGLTRLRLPRIVTGIVALMLRYLDVIAGELHRTRDAMTARGHDPRWLWQVRPIASSLGVLFVRSYERGERVHHAMLARGYTGAMPNLDDRRAAPRDWFVAAVPALIAWSALALSLAAGGAR